MEILEKLFGGSGRVKIMRLFLFNPAHTYDKEDVSKRSQVPLKNTSREIAHLEKTGLIVRKQFLKDSWSIRGKGADQKKVLRRAKAVGWHLNGEFPYLRPLESLLINLATLDHEYFTKKLQSAGKIKLIIISGIFIQDPASRVDLLVVGEKIKKAALDSVIKQIEAEIGKELRFASFEVPDFMYRISIYDKLVRDILDYPHKKLLDKMGMR